MILMVYTTHLWKKWGWFTKNRKKMEKPPNSGCRDWKEVALFNSSQDWARVNFRSSSYSLGGGNSPKKNKTTPTWSNHENWRSGNQLATSPFCRSNSLQYLGWQHSSSVLPRNLKWLVSTFLNHLLLEMFLGNHPRDADAIRKAAFDEESVLETKLDVYMLNMLTSKHLYGDAPKVN